MRCLIWKPGSFYRDTIKRVVHENIEIVVAEEKSDLVKAGNIDYIIIGEREHENIQELSEVCEMLNMSVVRVIPSAYVYYLHKKYTKYKYISLFKIGQRDLMVLQFLIIGLKTPEKDGG